jgi:hypothetical protein
MRLLHSLRTRLLLYNSLRMLLLLHLRAPRNSTAIVPIVINRLAHIVLPLVNLLPVLRSEPAAIRRTIHRRLMVDARRPLLPMTPEKSIHWTKPADP